MPGVRCHVVLAWFAVAIALVPRCAAQGRGTVEVSVAVGNYFPTQNYEPNSGACWSGFHFDNVIPYQPCDVYGSPKQRTFAPGGRLTAWVTQRVAFEAVAEYSGSTVLDNVWAGNVRGLLTLFRTGTMSWYLAGGPAVVAHSGVTTVTTTEHFTPHWGGVVGGGVHLPTSSRFAVRADLEEYITSDQGSAQHDIFFSLGLSLALGRAERH